LRIVKNLLFVLIIVWGMLALAVRLATPFVADFREQIAALVSTHLGAPVTIDALESRWYGLGPLLELRGVTIGGSGEPLAIASVSLNLAPFDLLTGSTLDALRVTIEGMQLTLVREATGQLHLEGVGPIAREGATRGDAPPLPSHFRLVDTRVVWIDRKARKAPLHIDNVDVVLDRDGRQLEMRARLETASGMADLSAQLEGFLTTQAWGGETYLRVDGLDVARLFAQYLPANYGLNSMHLDLESWGSWRDAAPTESQGRLRLSDLRLNPRSEDAVPLDLAEASADYTVRRTPGGLRVGLKDLQLTLDEQPWPAGDLAFDLTPSSDGTRRIALATDYLRIQDLVRILQVRLPSAQLKKPLELLRPGGVIRDLKLVAEMAPERFNWRARAKFEGIEITPWGKAPGIDNLSGSLRGQQDHLVLQLDSRDASVRFSDLFRDPLELPRLSGRLDIQRHGDGWQISSDRLIADTPHILTHTRLRLEKQPQQPVFLDLQTDFSEGDAEFALRYYPTAIMSTALVAWLDSTIKSGRVPGGSALVHGSLGDFPFADTSNGVFQVVFDTQDLELDYRQGWPRLEQVAAHVKFHGNSLKIDLHRGRVFDSEVMETTARVDRLTPASPLRMRGRVIGPLHDILRTLRSKALRDDFGDIAAALRARGESDLRLDFAIPLSEQDRYELQGQLQFDEAELSLPDWGFTMSEVVGQLNFDLHSLSAQAIKARAMGSPVVVDVLPRPDGATRVRTQGRLKLDQIRRQLPTLPLQLATGEADFVIGVDIPAGGKRGKSPVMLSVNSDLQGLEIKLPSPFGKPVDGVRPLTVNLPMGGPSTAGALAYGNLLNGRFSADGTRIDVVLGGSEASLGADPGIRIGGRLGKIDLAAWREALSPLADAHGGESPPLHIDLHLDRLFADIVGIDDLILRASLEHDMWRGSLEAPNLVGTFVAPGSTGHRPVEVDLQHLNLQIPVGGDQFEATPVPDPKSGPDPATLPGLALSIADLQINQAHLGRLQLDAQRAPEGLRLTQLSLRGGQLELDSAGYWSRLGNGFETRMGGRAETSDLGDLLVDLGYSRQVENAGGNIEWLLQWPGNPAQFHRATQVGTVSLDVDAGRVVELDPGVTRVVGLLNLNALTRRLRLDFSDIYKKGYSFDSIKGDFSFVAGKATTDNLRVVGPSGRIDLGGSADLVARSLDQHVTVTPNLDATLPIAGTLAGGPIAGIAVLVAQTVMNEQVDSIYRFEYSLQGPWGHPEITQLDSGGTLSRILLQLKTGNSEPASQAADASLPAATATPPKTTDSQLPGKPVSQPTAHKEESSTTDGAPPKTEPSEPESQSALDHLLNVLKKSESHGAGLPGTSN